MHMIGNEGLYLYGVEVVMYGFVPHRLGDDNHLGSLGEDLCERIGSGVVDQLVHTDDLAGAEDVLREVVLLVLDLLLNQFSFDLRIEHAHLPALHHPPGPRHSSATPRSRTAAVPWGAFAGRTPAGRTP